MLPSSANFLRFLKFIQLFTLSLIISIKKMILRLKGIKPIIGVDLSEQKG